MEVLTWARIHSITQYPLQQPVIFSYSSYQFRCGWINTVHPKSVVLQAVLIIAIIRIISYPCFLSIHPIHSPINTPFSQYTSPSLSTLIYLHYHSFPIQSTSFFPSFQLFQLPFPTFPSINLSSLSHSSHPNLLSSLPKSLSIHFRGNSPISNSHKTSRCQLYQST